MWKKYFQPSANVIRIIKNIKNKYQLNNYDDLCALYYRGTDKIQEVDLPSYEGFLEKVKILKAKQRLIFCCNPMSLIF